MAELTKEQKIRLRAFTPMDTPPKMLAKMARKLEPWEIEFYKGLANPELSPNTPPEILALLPKRNIEIDKQIAQNPSIPPEIFNKWKKD